MTLNGVSTNWRPSFTAQLKEHGIQKSMIWDPTSHSPSENEEARELARYNVYYINGVGTPEETSQMISECTTELQIAPDKTVVILDISEGSQQQRTGVQNTQNLLRNQFPNSKILNREEAFQFFQNTQTQGAG